MNSKLYITVFIVSIYAARGYYDRFKGMPVLFPSDLARSLNLIKNEEKEPTTPYVSKPPSSSREPLTSQSKSEFYKNPTLSQSRSSDTRYTYPYSYLRSSKARLMYPQMSYYHYGYPIRNYIISVPKTFAQKKTPSCVESSSLDGICEEDPDYDAEVEERFAKALQKVNISEEFYKSILSKMMVETSPSITSRVGSNDILLDPVCPATETFKYPRRGMTRSNDWVFVLNQGNMKQAIKVEECANSTGLSRLMVNGELSCGITTNSDFQSVCRQKYIYKNVIAMDSSGNNIETKAILIPSCCTCLRKLSSSRFGNQNVMEFDESGNLITEQPSIQKYSTHEAKKNESDVISDDEDFSFGFEKMKTA